MTQPPSTWTSRWLLSLQHRRSLPCRKLSSNLAASVSPDVSYRVQALWEEAAIVLRARCRTARASHGSHQPFYALHPHGMDGTRAPDTVEEMAAEYLDAILACQCEGPYYLSGYSFGGLIALEMAHQLLDRGHEVALLALLDSGGPDTARAGQRTFLGVGADSARRLLARLCNLYLRPGRYLPLRWRLSYFLGVSRGASQRYVPRRYPGHIHILHAADNPRTPQLRWAGMSTAGLTVDEVPGHHTSMLAEPHVQRVAAQLSQVLQAAQKRRSKPALLAGPGLAAEPNV